MDSLNNFSSGNGKMASRSSFSGNFNTENEAHDSVRMDNDYAMKEP